MKKKFLVSLLCICALVTGLLLTGCGSSEGGESKGGDTLVYGSQDYTAINLPSMNTARSTLCSLQA